MAINFPSSPTLNQQVTLAGVVWTYDGKGWFPSASPDGVTSAYSTIAVPGELSLVATGGDTLNVTPGQNITITTNPATDALTINATGNLQVQSGYQANRQTFTASGSTSTFTLTETPTSADNLLVFVSGVQQPRSYYSLSGNNLILGGIPNAGEEIDVIDLSAGVSVMGINRSVQDTVAVLNQTTVTVNGGYTPGQVDVYLNGVILFGDEYTATDGQIITFASPLGAADEVRVIKYTPLSVAPVDFIIKRETFTAVDDQTTFTTLNGYNTGYVDVYLNGIRLVETIDFIAIDGYTVTLTQAAVVDDVLLVQTYYATNNTNLVSGNLTITGQINLGQVSNVAISGGAPGTYLASDGANGLVFTTVTTLAAGNSNVVLSANSNVSISSAGVPGALIVSGGNVYVANQLSSVSATMTGQLTAGSFSVGSGTSTGTITSRNVYVNENLTVNGVTNLNTVANIRIAGGIYGQVLTTDGTGNVSFTTPSVGITTGKSIAMALVFGG